MAYLLLLDKEGPVTVALIVLCVALVIGAGVVVCVWLIARKSVRDKAAAARSAAKKAADLFTFPQMDGRRVPEQLQQLLSKLEPDDQATVLAEWQTPIDDLNTILDELTQFMEGAGPPHPDPQRHHTHSGLVELAGIYLDFAEQLIAAGDALQELPAYCSAKATAIDSLSETISAAQSAISTTVIAIRSLGNKKFLPHPRSTRIRFNTATFKERLAAASTLLEVAQAAQRSGQLLKAIDAAQAALGAIIAVHAAALDAPERQKNLASQRRSLRIRVSLLGIQLNDSELALNQAQGTIDPTLAAEIKEVIKQIHAITGRLRLDVADTLNRRLEAQDWDGAATLAKKIENELDQARHAAADVKLVVRGGDPSILRRHRRSSSK
jgi:hypothetical protein